MKITLSQLRRVIREELESRMGGDDEIMARLSAHREKQAASWAAQPAPKEGPGLSPEELSAFPGALESYPEDPETARFWEEGGSLNAVDQKLGHRSRMLFGKDGQWHKFYNTPKPVSVDRRAR